MCKFILLYFIDSKNVIYFSIKYYAGEKRNIYIKNANEQIAQYYFLYVNKPIFKRNLK